MNGNVLKDKDKKIFSNLVLSTNRHNIDIEGRPVFGQNTKSTITKTTTTNKGLGQTNKTQNNTISQFSDLHNNE